MSQPTLDDWDTGDYFSPEEPDPQLKRRKQGCITLLLLATFGLLGGVFFLLARPSWQSAHPAATPTWTMEDGLPLDSQSGLEQSLIAPQTQEVLAAQINPNSLQALNQIEYPQGAFYDAESGQLVIFGPPAKTPGQGQSDFLTALGAVYNQQPLAVSIDPGSDPTIQSVRYEGPTENTHLGWVMFEADRRMKTLSLGQDNETSQPVSANVAGYANMLTLAEQFSTPAGQEIRRRFWFTTPRVTLEQSADGLGMVITEAGLEVKTEYLDANWQTATSQPPDPAGQAFAAHLSQRLDDYAVEYPIFHDLQAAARWTALAHWLKQANLPINPALWLEQTPAVYATPKETPAITATQTSADGTHIWTVWGGVTLEMQPETRPISQQSQNRLQKVAAQFARLLKGVQPADADGLALAPVSPLRALPITPATVMLEKSIGLKMAWEGQAWQIQIPRLKRVGQAENSFFYLQNWKEGESLVLTYGGFDTRTQASVFINREAGLWLEETPQGFQLQGGRFENDGTFSYPENGQPDLFNAQGQALTLKRLGLTYSYQDGNLTWVEQNSQRVEFFYTGEQLQRARSTAGEETRLQWQGGRLTGSSSGVSFSQSFTYDDAGRLTAAAASDGSWRKMVYDSQGELSAVFQNGEGMLLRHVGGALSALRGPALETWKNADATTLNDLYTAWELRPQTGHVLFARQVGDEVLVLADERSFHAPKSLLSNPAALRRKLSEALEPQPGEQVLLSVSGVEAVNFHLLFPKALTLTVEKMDEARVARNLALLEQIPRFDSASGRALNGLPQTHQAAAAGLAPDDGEAWNTERLNLDEALRGYLPDLPPGESVLTRALSEKPLVLLVVAHSDGQEIFFPDGSRFSPEALSEEQRQAIRAQSPLVILLSCDTGLVIPGQKSLAQKMLELGPRMVVAPNGKLDAAKATEIVKFFLTFSSRENALQAIFRAIWQVFPDGLWENKFFFDFRVQQNERNAQNGRAEDAAVLLPAG